MANDDGKESYAKGIDATKRKAHEEAIQHFTDAAERGHVDAQYTLGLYYQGNLHGIDNADRDMAKAIVMFEMAAAQGHSDAQFFLADIYSNGDGVPENREKAVEWYERAAADGHEKAKDALLSLGKIEDGREEN